MMFKIKRYTKLLVFPLLALAIALDFKCLYGQDVQNINPTQNSMNMAIIETSEILDVESSSIQFNANYARNVAIELDKNQRDVNSILVENLSVLDISFSKSMNRFFEFSVALPYGFSSGKKKIDFLKDQKNMLDSGSGFNQLRLMPKFQILDHKQFKGFGLALSLPQNIPIKDEKGDILKVFYTINFKLVLDYKIQKLKIALNVGYRHRFNDRENPSKVVNCENASNKICYDPFYLGDAINYGLGLSYEILHKMSIGSEIYGRYFYDQATNPLEAMLTFKSKASDDSHFTMSVSKGLVSYISSPSYRFMFSFSMLINRNKDSDGDGILDHLDVCIQEKEDRDGFQDLDGCIDKDNDQDGIEDENDKCPMQAEDMDGFEDIDGCIDIDNDKDGIIDMRDSCPNEPENQNKYQDNDGCPDEHELSKKKDFVQQQLSLKGRFYFEKNSHRLAKESNAILVEIYDVLSSNPNIEELVIECHTGVMGDEKKNLELSNNRAMEIRNRLISMGIDSKKLLAIGYGSSKPISNDDSKNKRVTFIVVKSKEN